MSSCSAILNEGDITCCGGWVGAWTSRVVESVENYDIYTALVKS
jgi:hypothetical protein